MKPADEAERLRGDGLRVWFDEWEIRPGDSIPAKLEAGQEHSRVLVLCMPGTAFGFDPGAPGLEAGTFRFRDPLNQQLRFIPVRLDEARIKASRGNSFTATGHRTVGESMRTPARRDCRPPVKPSSALPAKTTAVLDYVNHCVENQAVKETGLIRGTEW